MPEQFPSIFVSHGAPTLPMEPGPAREFLGGLGRSLGRPDAILVISAHWEARDAAVSGAAQPDTIHDFFGFPGELYRLAYPAPGAPALAARVSNLLGGKGIGTRVHPNRGLDHGAWIPLLLMYPDADIPVTQLTVQPMLGARHQYEIGAALRPLRSEGVLILGSGATTHNLHEFRRHRCDAPVPEWVDDFQDWLATTVETGNTEDFLNYRMVGPNAQRNHPTEEHIMPIFVAAGAGSPGVLGCRIHRSNVFGVIAMDAYRYD